MSSLEAYATDQCPEVKNPSVDCTHLGCTSILNPTCQAKCNFGLDILGRCPLPSVFAPGGGILDTINKGVAAQQFGNSPGFFSTSSPPGSDPNSDCNSWGVAKPLCVFGKSITKGVGSIGAPCTIAGHTLPLPCWALLAAGGLIAVMVIILKIK